MKKGCYAIAKEGVVRLGNENIEVSIDSRSGGRLSELTNKITGRVFHFEDSAEAVRLGASQHRIDILEWRCRAGSGTAVAAEDEKGFKAGWHTTEVNDSNWPGSTFINDFHVGLPGYSQAIYPGYAWYRTRFALSDDAKGQSIEIGVGGCDNQDWLQYRVFINGQFVGEFASDADWHEYPRFTINPGDSAYAALNFSGDNLLAVQCRGLDRRITGAPDSDCERYSVGGFLVEQYVSVGPAARELSDFRLTGHHLSSNENKSSVELDFVNAEFGVSLKVTYWVDGDEPTLYKQISVRNESRNEQTLLELDIQNLSGDLSAAGGGMGYPCSIGGEVFCGVMNPAGVAIGDGNRVSLGSYPGVKLAPGETYDSKTAVFGVGPANEAGASFVAFMEQHGPRKRELLRMYHCYGIHDVAGMEEPTDLTEEMVTASLDRLEEFKKRGIDFDFYFIDAGWSNPTGDVKDFDPRFFPNGPKHLFERMEKLGMRHGLWTSPLAGPMAFHQGVAKPDLWQCGTLPAEEGAEAHRGLLCIAAEPWHSMYKDALLHHVRVNNSSGFKFDGNALLCNNPDHGHMLGRYSCEAIGDAMIDIINSVRLECPEAFFMFYWNIRASWWLLWGNTIYERGVLMEGATPSDEPTRLFRQSITISFDQTTHLAWDRVPLPCGDSLGVWLSKWRWASYICREGWRDAWVMDIARGSMMCQLWGDMYMLNDEDVDFLADISAWLKENSELLKNPKRILGDPWKSEPYGYAYFQGDTGSIFVYNPRFEAVEINLSLTDEIGFSSSGDDKYALEQVYPKKGILGDSPIGAGGSFSVMLKPFEVKLIDVKHAGDVSSERLAVGSNIYSKQLQLNYVQEFEQMLNWSEDADISFIRRVLNGRVSYVDFKDKYEPDEKWTDERDLAVVRRVLQVKTSVPDLPEKAVFILTARLSRDGVFWHHHALYDIIKPKITLAGRELELKPTPHRWHEQAGGWSWILFEAELPMDSAGQVVDIELSAYIPESVDVELKSWVYSEDEERI